MADKPFFLELVGRGITTTFSLHFASVLSNATWPQVDCHRIYTHQMIKPAIVVQNGSAKVPDAPGLGVELDEDAVERLRIQPIAKPYPKPGLLIAIRWPEGSTSYYAHAEQYWDDVRRGVCRSFRGTSTSSRLRTMGAGNGRSFRRAPRRVASWSRDGPCERWVFHG